MTWELLDRLCQTLMISWCFAGMYLRGVRQGAWQQSRFAVGVFMWLKPIYLLVTISHYAVLWDAALWIRVPLFGMYLWFWFRFKDEGDDRWKKLRKKVKEKIARLGSRLVVVPTPSS